MNDKAALMSIWKLIRNTLKKGVGGNSSTKTLISQGGH